LFERIIPGAALEILSFAVTVTTATKLPSRLSTVAEKSSPAPIGTARIYDGRTRSTLDVPVLDRLTLSPGSRIAGPSVVVEPGTSTVVTAAFRGRVDAGHALVLERD
jgi:N-methylhydantoinase A